MTAPEVRVQMLIRRPVAEVFEAFVDPSITTRFWFSKGSDRLETDRRIRWDWEMYGVGTEVEVQVVEPNRRILIQWDPDAPTFVEWTFEAESEERTMVRIRNWGFEAPSDDAVARALDSTGGFAFLLASAKAFLEHGIELNLVADHEPSAVVPGWKPRRPDES